MGVSYPDKPHFGAPKNGEPSYGRADPIAALATPLGESALALIRTSGGGTADNAGGNSLSNNLSNSLVCGAGHCTGSAIELFARIFSLPAKLLSAPASSVVHGWIVEPESPGEEGVLDKTQKKIDEVLLSVYRAPRSYTGEDSVEITCHGGIAAVKAIMAALKNAGFREALPGEFTFRAFMNGKLDLTRAESVMELVSAKTGRGREQAVRRLSGALEKEITVIKALLVDVLAGTEIYLDYSEDEFFGKDDDEEAGRLPERSLAEEAARRLKTISELWSRERIYADGALAVIAGRPNAGKSSLFNYLIKEDRSIVTDTPGTTRDWIEAIISVEGIPLRLADTAGLRGAGLISAGLRDVETGTVISENTDEVERIGIQRSLELLGNADIVLYIIDGTQGITMEDRDFILARREASPTIPLLALWNKADLAPFSPSKQNEIPCSILPVSAKTGEGIDNLLRSTADLLESASALSSPEPCMKDTAGPGTLRQKDLIDTALASVEEALSLAAANEPLDIIAPLFRSAINALGEITGEVTNADILEAMFGRFCVGK